jgi:hypothetical protein
MKILLGFLHQKNKWLSKANRVVADVIIVLDKGFINRNIC